MRSLSGVSLGLMAAAMLVGRPSEQTITLRPSRIRVAEPVSVPRYNLGSRSYVPNGAREVARRLRQIERGQLKAANGLVS